MLASLLEAFSALFRVSVEVAGMVAVLRIDPRFGNVLGGATAFGVSEALVLSLLFFDSAFAAHGGIVAILRIEPRFDKPVDGAFFGASSLGLSPLTEEVGSTVGGTTSPLAPPSKFSSFLEDGGTTSAGAALASAPPMTSSPFPGVGADGGMVAILRMEPRFDIPARGVVVSGGPCDLGLLSTLSSVFCFATDGGIVAILRIEPRFDRPFRASELFLELLSTWLSLSNLRVRNDGMRF